MGTTVRPVKTQPTNAHQFSYPLLMGSPLDSNVYYISPFFPAHPRSSSIISLPLLPWLTSFHSLNPLSPFSVMPLCQHPPRLPTQYPLHLLLTLRSNWLQVLRHIQTISDPLRRGIPQIHWWLLWLICKTSVVVVVIVGITIVINANVIVIVGGRTICKIASVI